MVRKSLKSKNHIFKLAKFEKVEIYMDHAPQYIRQTNNYKFEQPQETKKYVIYVCAYNSSILRPITTKFGTHVYCTTTYSTNQQLQVCKQQTLVNYNLLMLCRPTMKFGRLVHYTTCA